MSFGAPGYLLFLLLVPVLLIGAGLWVAWRARARERFGARAMPPAPAAAWWAVFELLTAAVALAAFAAARPQIGTNDTRVEERGIDAVVVLDVSTSMLAQDAQPTRLARAQDEIQTMLDRMHGDRVGLVIFARDPFVRSPLTTDIAALRTITGGVGEERVLVSPGSDLGAAIASATKLLRLDDGAGKAMIVVSDGEDHGASIAPAVAQAREADIHIYTAGVGTERGAPVRDVDAVTFETHDRRDPSGNLVITHLDSQALQQIASDGGGRYIELSGDDRPLTGLVAELDGLAPATFATKESALHIDRFRIFAAIALVLVMASFVAPALLRRARAPRGLARALPLAGAGLFVGAICSAGVAEVNRRGNSAYDAGNYAQSIAQYQTAEAIDPSKGEVYHNEGNAYDQTGAYDQAIDETRKAIDRAQSNPDLEAKAEYGLGNHFAAKQALEDAREAYRRSLLADPSDVDAKHNLEIIDQRLNATPTPSPTPTQGPPQGTQEPADQTAEASGQQQGTAQADATSPTGQGGTPSPSDAEPSPEELQQQLDEALRGIDRNFTEEEALRVLDLLQRANRAATEQHGGGPDAAPEDY